MTTIGTVREVKDNENRVGITPHTAKELIQAGHEVYVEANAGKGSGFSDQEYTEAGAQILSTPEEVAKTVDILVKVKEPIASEYPLLALLENKILYTYLHLAGVDPQLTQELLKNAVTSIAYETVEDDVGGLPLLTPMSQVAGVLSVQYGAEYLQKKYGGRGITLGRIDGTPSANVLVIGAGVVGSTAALSALGMGAQVTLVDINEEILKKRKEEMEGQLGPLLMKNATFTVSEESAMEGLCKEADLLVGAVLVAGAKAPTVITENHVKSMKTGAVIVDVAIDQGGCIWGSKPTSHTEPIYTLEGKIFCCVTNMPGQAALQSTLALTTATLPLLLEVAKDFTSAMAIEKYKKGLMTEGGRLKCEAVAKALDIEYSP